MRIERIEVFPLCYPTKGYFKFFDGGARLKGRHAVIVKITADDGTVGWGQSVPVTTWTYETLESVTSVIKEYFASALIRTDPCDIEGAQGLMDAAIAPGFSTGMPLARAGIDIALHDLAGKLQGKSIAALYGLPRGAPLTLSWTVNARSLDEADRIMDDGWSQGYRHFNIKVAPDLEYDLQLARRVRERAPEGFLWADANGGYDPETALLAARELADAGVNVLESPVRPNQISAWQAIRSLSALPILMDEGVVSPVELKEFIRLGMCDGAAMKPSRCGGLLSCRRQIEIILDSGLLWLGSGLSDPDIALAASVCLYSACGLKKPAALNGPQFLDDSVLKVPLAIGDGRVVPPDGPGLGIEIDEDRVRALIVEL